MLRRHAIPPGTPLLEVNAHLMSGVEDAIVPSVSVARWAKFFAGAISHHEIAGGHFFPFRESQNHVLTLITEILRPTVARRTR
jgi:surfactin synthase thioesterase subunit